MITVSAIELKIPLLTTDKYFIKIKELTLILI